MVEIRGLLGLQQLCQNCEMQAFSPQDWVDTLRPVAAWTTDGESCPVFCNTQSYRNALSRQHECSRLSFNLSLKGAQGVCHTHAHAHLSPNCTNKVSGQQRPCTTGYKYCRPFLKFLWQKPSRNNTQTPTQPNLWLETIS